MTKTHKQDSVRVAAIAALASKAATAAVPVFEVIAKELLSEGARVTLREGAEGLVTTVLGGSAKQLAAAGSRQLAGQAGRAAFNGAKAQIHQPTDNGGAPSGAGGALGTLLGCGLGGGLKFSKGELTGGQALSHVAKEGGTEAAAAGVGVLAAAGLVVLTGPVGPGVAVLVSGATSIASKAGLRALFR